MSVPDPEATDWVPIYAGAPTLDYVGDYVPATSYHDGDIVMYNGTPWLCVKTTNTPPEPFEMTVMGGAPTGGLMQFAGAAAPSGWLICDGASLLRADYAALFAVIGTIYGFVDATHFNIPDMRGRAPYGITPGQNTGVDELGENEGRTDPAQRGPYHGHLVHDPTHAHSVYDPGHTHYMLRIGGPDGQSGVQAGFGAGMDWYGTDARGTGIDIYGAGTGITVGDMNWGAASGDAASYLGINFIIKT